MPSPVSRVPAAEPSQAIEHFAARLGFETDCWDVHHAIVNDKQDFVLLDVRSEEVFGQGHLPNAINLPHWQINETNLEPYGPDTLFVVLLRRAPLQRSQQRCFGVGQTGQTGQGNDRRSRWLDRRRFSPGNRWQ